MGQVFISYSRDDARTANAIAVGLRGVGLDVWIDTASLGAGDDISQTIDSQIARAGAVLVLWSQKSKDSTWVRGEAFRALELDKYFGVTLEDVSPPVPFNARNAPNLGDWTGSALHTAWERLVTDLVRKLGGADHGVLAVLAEQKAREQAEVARKIAGTQEQLPFEEEPALVEGEKYDDVESLIRATAAILSSSRKLELAAAVTQAALEQELLRSARFLVAKDDWESRASGAIRCSTIQDALDAASPDDLIVVAPGRYDENIRIRSRVRIVGLGPLDDRPLIVATRDDYAVAFQHSARLENVVIETRKEYPAVHCAENQPVLLRCAIVRFSRKRAGGEDAALYVAGRANPILVACSVTSNDSPGIYFVTNSGGRFVGVDVLTSRAASVVCRGRPVFEGGSIEATGNHAIEVRGQGHPTFDECKIGGRGAPVVKVAEYGRPQITNSKLHAIRQRAFDFEGNAGGRFERNVVFVEAVAEEPTPAPPRQRSWIDRMLRKQDEIVRLAVKTSKYVSMRSGKEPVFIANKNEKGEAVGMPS